MTDCKRVECMGNNGCIDKCWKPQPTWVGLTDEDRAAAWSNAVREAAIGESTTTKCFAIAIEAKLKEKNNG